MKRIVDIPDYSLDEVQNGSIACEQILKAVKNSKPISTENDLISREYLKDAFDNLCCHNCKTCRNFRIEGCSFYRCALIENAPTVKFSLMPADETKEDAYKRGYERGKIAGILEANTRPQGEWIEKVEVEVVSQVIKQFILILVLFAEQLVVVRNIHSAIVEQI